MYLYTERWEVFLTIALKGANMALPIGTTARTGEKCPESGVWQVIGTPTTTAPIARGNVMPPYGGRAVTWRLSRLA